MDNLQSFAHSGFQLAKRTVTKWQQDKVSRLAAALAYFAVLSIPSILVLAVAVAGQLVGEQAAQSTILEQAGRLMGREGRAAIRTMLDAARQPRGASLATILSVAVLLFGASGVFVQLQGAMNTIYDVRPDPHKGLANTLRKRVFSFAIVIALGLLLAAILLVNSLVALLGQSLAELLPGSLVWVRVLNFLVSFLLLIAMIAIVFKVIPDAEVTWQDAVLGALVTAILFTIGVIALGLYFEYGDPTTSYGAAGSLILLLIWVYYSAQILFIGAEFTQTYATRYGSKILPDDNAVWTAPAKAQFQQGRSDGPSAQAG